ncbi:MAG: OmpA family protein [Desulfovibrio sp.]|jgi:OOP family OmpA-OmpF porin|nr:OmpA family protein [Desulfovibrio sp.]
MKIMRFVPVAVLLLLAAAFCAPSAPAREMVVRKADNVFFCVDTSGSMMSDYHGGGQTDLAAARQLLARMTRAMPDLGYATALFRFAPYESLRALEPHDQAAFEQALAQVPVKVPMFGNRTPLGNGLFDLAWPVSEVPGPTAVILFTDGGQNEGEPPLPVAEQLYAAYDICLHVVSFANTPREQAVIDELAGLNLCSVTASADELMHSDEALAAFLKNTLWEKKAAPAPPPPPPAAKREFHTVRMDLYLEFDTNSAQIRPEFHDEIAKVGEVLRKYPKSTAMIVGYTDDVGSYAENIRLSTNRARAMRDHLVREFQVAPDRLQAVGYGENFPVEANASAEGRQRNRRVSVYVTGWFVETE